MERLPQDSELSPPDLVGTQRLPVIDFDSISHGEFDELVSSYLLLRAMHHRVAWW